MLFIFHAILMQTIYIDIMNMRNDIKEMSAKIEVKEQNIQYEKRENERIFLRMKKNNRTNKRY